MEKLNRKRLAWKWSLIAFSCVILWISLDALFSNVPMGVRVSGAVLQINLDNGEMRRVKYRWFRVSKVEQAYSPLFIEFSAINGIRHADAWVDVLANGLWSPPGGYYFPDRKAYNAVLSVGYVLDGLPASVRKTKSYKLLIQGVIDKLRAGKYSEITETFHDGSIREKILRDAGHEHEVIPETIGPPLK